ncbi:unnamed protein product [Wuchereria bancrofti]|uniref:Uncharacterized protein n=1 Tax=Wuchereria bancrofti TaxID=6293 RepID=A0A3P7FV16_WUCBA|nr:unnamed protein product [Wuchereria bancrofti]
MQKNFNNSKEEEKFNDDEDDMNVSNADYFNAIIHAIIPGPLDIPSLYRTYTMLPLTNDRRKNHTFLSSTIKTDKQTSMISSTTINYSSIFINKNIITNTNINDTTIPITTSAVGIAKITDKSLISVKYTTTNCTRYSGNYWDTIAPTTNTINCNSDNAFKLSEMNPQLKLLVT